MTLMKKETVYYMEYPGPVIKINIHRTGKKYKTFINKNIELEND